MLYIDAKYLKLASHKLELFKQKNQYAWNFRCPFCGDSEKHTHKARGNVYNNKGTLLYKCFNCQYSCSVGNLIKYVDFRLYSEYLLERYKDDTKSTEQPEFLFKKEEVELKDSVLDNLVCLTDLPDSHYAVEYVNSRLIPKSSQERIFLCNEFKHWSNSLIPDKFKTLSNDSPRLVFPYYNKHGKVFAVNARAFGDIEPKYIILKFDENQDTVYGLDTVDWSSHIYVVEGQIDSLFLPNCLAVSGSNFINDTTSKILSNSTHIFDNEPRNKQLCKLIEKSIKGGFRVCLLPVSFEHKDINDAVIAGMSINEIVELINKNTYSGLYAEIEFIKWRKCEI